MEKLRNKKIKTLLFVLALNALISVGFLRHPVLSEYAPSEVINRLKKAQLFSKSVTERPATFAISLCDKSIQRR